jgi:hypothetical protein
MTVQYVFEIGGKSPVVGKTSLQLALKPGDPHREIGVIARLENGHVLTGKVKASADPAPPASLSLSKDTLTYTTNGASTGVRASLANARPGTEGVPSTGRLTMPPREATAIFSACPGWNGTGLT